MAIAYYNEINPTAAAWLRNLIAGGMIPAGDVDERSIEDVTPDDLRGYTQCHFFAGLGGWAHALRLAGWPDDRPIWTGSCPCQPFSQAGQGLGLADERHLWPSFFWLIQNCSPPFVCGEQVSGADGLEWFDVVFADLEKELYAVAGFDLCAASIGAPHIRQRLYWLADADRQRCERNRELSLRAEKDPRRKEAKREQLANVPARLRSFSGVADTDCQQRQNSIPGRREGDHQKGKRETVKSTGFRLPGGLANSDSLIEQRGLSGRPHSEREVITRQAGLCRADSRPGPVNGYWSDADWLSCRDGKWRPARPGSFPLAHGIPGRVGRVSAYGNAIVAPLAAEFIRAYMEI